jgi:hypothetical protein
MLARSVLGTYRCASRKKYLYSGKDPSWGSEVLQEMKIKRNWPGKTRKPEGHKNLRIMLAKQVATNVLEEAV